MIDCRIDSAASRGYWGSPMMNWKDRYAERVSWVTSSALSDMLRLTQQADVISFSGGLPAPELFPVERFRQAADLVLRVYGERALQYSPTEGYSPLRRWIASSLNQHGASVDESNVLITTGSQQATELIGRLLIDEGDPVLVESPTYVGALQAFGVYRPRFVVVPNDGDGLLVDELESFLELEPKFLYLLPNFQNPSGTTLPLARRTELVSLSRSWGVPVVEDDPYSQLRYEGEPIPPLLALDAQVNGAERRYVGTILYHGTLSKLLAPGLRVGWVVATAEVVQQLAALKQGVDLHTSTLAQMIAYEVAKGGFLGQHVERLRQIYQQRRDVMLEAMETYFPAEVSWTRPKGGLFILVTLPAGIDARDVLVESLKQMVAFVPGESFFPTGGGENTFRLNFSNAKPDRIVEGIRRLGTALEAFCRAAGGGSRRV
jgi:2-aminoadipate transaminase